VGATEQLMRDARALLEQAGQSTIGDDGEGIHLLPSGKIRAVIGGTKYDLRRPKIGQFRALNEYLHEIDAEEKVRIAAVQEQPGTNGQARSVDSTDLLLGWMRKVFETLGSPIDLDNDDLPVWMANPTLPVEMIRHWRELPLARSVPR
jgi:hypothetical protein